MKLTVREAAAMLGVSETTVYHWVDTGDVPFVTIHHQPRFHRLELLDWAMDNDVPPTDLSWVAESVSLSQALERGEHHRVDTIGAAIGRLPVGRATAVIYEARLSVALRHVGDGIALPRAHSPIVVPGGLPIVGVFTCDPAIRIADAQIRTLMLVVAPSVRDHLHLVSIAAASLRDPGVRDAIGSSNADARARLLAAVRAWETSLAGGAP